MTRKRKLAAGQLVVLEVSVYAAICAVMGTKVSIKRFVWSSV